MDYEKYYDKKADGAYVLHFPNSKGVSLSELKDIFSAYGEVLSVDDRGKSFGLCFIRYQKLDEVKRCLDGLRNHEFIKILQHKSKMQTNQKKKHHDQDQGTNNRSSPVPNSENRFHNKRDNTKSKRYSSQETDNHSDCSESRSVFKRGNNFINDDTLDKDNGSDSSLINSRKSLNHFLKLKMLKRAASSTSVSSETVEENTQRIKETIDHDDIPPLICKGQKLMGSSRRFSRAPSTIPAQEVIVANIHPNFGIHYILHLFEKHNPLSVSLMMTTPKTRIRYCHVYFETPAEAVATEKEFDMHLLQGSSLIVLRSQRLMEEALFL